MDATELILLYDYYGALLTDRQRECFELRYNQDLSLGEIAQELGIGIAADETIRAVIACKKGSGRDVLLALTHALWGEQISLEVASTNTRAMRLYDRLGFIPTAELSRWYNVL